eukprot:gnl/Dysnectes_brevis/9066_a16581_287.p1 GENE.gnl/Dysnectes_brevis/9066_a16581_287~~gnl/Dysnectes_brevis/9066_a16581_287.p1  ORF type:complete len:125 (+),score=1.32 gnl/Dysnectes_brevis/9066_a16581_287:44-418(+)
MTDSRDPVDLEPDSSSDSSESSDYDLIPTLEATPFSASLFSATLSLSAWAECSLNLLRNIHEAQAAIPATRMLDQLNYCSAKFSSLEEMMECLEATEAEYQQYQVSKWGPPADESSSDDWDRIR